MNAPLLAGEAQRFQRLDRRGVYIFPSRPGLTLAMVLIIILLGAINYDNALGYLLSFLLAGLLLVAMLHTWHNLAGLRFIGARAAPVFAGQTAQFECLLDNDRAMPRLNLTVKYWPRDLNGEQRRYLKRFETELNIPANHIATARVSVDAVRRGWLELERIRLETVYPLGVLRAWAYFDSPAQCLVYPAPRGSLPLPRATNVAAGEAAATTDGADEFAGMRRYTPGDPVRAIAWKTLAKDQHVMIKRFQGQSALQFWLSWSAVAAIRGLEPRVSQLAAWVLEADQNDASFGLELPGVRIELGRGPQHRDDCLTALALFREW